MAKRPASRAKKDREERAAKAERLEWIVGVASAILVLALIGVLAFEAVIGGRTPPDLRVEHGDLRAGPDTTILPIRIVNTGASTAADVVVEGRRGEERSTVTLDYVAGDSIAEAALVFSGDEMDFAIETRVVGFTKP